jgi:hypothetical protein
MTLREEIRQYMVASEILLDCSAKVEELTYIEVELIQYYLLKVAQRFPS